MDNCWVIHKSLINTENDLDKYLNLPSNLLTYMFPLVYIFGSTC